MLEIKNLKDLSQIIDLARKKGLNSIKIDGIELHLKDEAPLSLYKKKQTKDLPSDDKIEIENTYNESEILFWSSAGLPEVEGAH